MKSFRERSPFLLGVIGTVVLVAIGLTTFYAEDLPVIGGGTTYEAEFSEAAGIEVDNEVRVAGIKVGKVTDVDLAEDRVLVSFRVKDTWIGDQTSAEIKVKTLLGRKFLSLHPVGRQDQDPDEPIPLDRTVTPYDVTEAFEDLSDTVDAIDTDQLAESFRTMSDTFEDSPDHVHAALDGLSALSTTIASRDDQVAELLENTRDVSSILADSSEEFDQLIDDGNLLLTELDHRRDDIHALLTGTRDLAEELSGLVADNQEQLGPALEELDTVTDVLERQADNLDRSFELASPYFRVVNNIVGNGRWIDSYICGLVPENRDPCTPPNPSGGGN